ncbi:hypothetical protein HYZ99_04770 [Candidatus Peregrinibacteria bacterium]|nr:hypothetical protein [Candidatus Peregrinibacteria bacterium]
MTPREIIAAAWAITTKEKSLRRWAFTSSFLETLLSVKLLSYQLYFVYEYLYRGGEAGFFDIEMALYNRLPFWLFLTIITIFILMVVIELFMPHLCLGAIIGLAAKSYRKEEVKGGLVLGLYNFFPIFAIHEFLILSSLATVITAISLIIRYIDPALKAWSIGAVIFLFFVANTLKFFFSFAEEAVVIRKQGIFEAIGKSFKLIVSHLSHIMFLLILLFVITLRIIFNVAVVIVVPALVIGIAFLLTMFLPTVWSYGIAAVLGVILIFIASYFFAYLHAFKQTVWTLTYMELSSRKELDVIEET